MADDELAALRRQVQDLQIRLGEAEEALAARDEALARWTLMGEQLPAILWTTDADLRFTSGVGGGLAPLGRKPNELVGVSIYEYFQSTDPNLTPIAMHLRALRGETAQYESEWLGRAYHSHIEPLRGRDGRVTGTVGVALDITERKRAEHLAQRLADLAHVSRLSLMGEMATGLAHELNQPLAAISNYARGCARRIRARPSAITPPVMLEALDEIAGQATRAAEIIQWIRNFVRRREPECVSASLPDLIRTTLKILEADLRSHRICVHLDLAPETPPVSIDRIQIEQVVLNLARNAVEAMTATNGPRKLTLRTAALSSDQVEVTVADTGCGLSAEEAARVFDTFFTTKPQGLGMGLAISRSIVEAHGGRLWAEVDPHRQGAVFHFTLPACTEEDNHDPSPDRVRR